MSMSVTVLQYVRVMKCDRTQLPESTEWPTEKAYAKDTTAAIDSAKARKGIKEE